MARVNTNVWDAEQYADSSFIQGRHIKRVLKDYSFIDGGELLDIGCGDGHITERLAKSLPKSNVLGIDRSDNMIDYAKAQYQYADNLDFCVQDVLSLDEHERFNQVVSFFCLHWTDQQAEVLQRVSRALKPKGQLLFVLPSGDDVVKLATELGNEFIQHASVEEYRVPAYFFKDDAYLEFLKATDLVIDSVERVHDPIPLANIEMFRKFVEALPIFQYCFPENIIPQLYDELVKRFETLCQQQYQGQIIFDTYLLVVKAHKP